MLKQLMIPVLGLAVLAGTAASATADRGKTRVIESQPQYTYGTQRTQRTTAPKQRQYKKKFEDTLDFETEAVWRNLRPSRFVD